MLACTWLIWELRKKGMRERERNKDNGLMKDGKNGERRLVDYGR